MATIDGAAWQASWDAQQTAYLPDREERFAAMLDVVEAVTGPGRPVRLLDLAGGTGSISLRALRRWPAARVTLLDVDPVLLAIAGASLPAGAEVVRADLTAPDWPAALPGDAAGAYDAVLTATAMHWLPEPALREVYHAVADLLRPGGVLLNADHLADDGLPGLSHALGELGRRRREQTYADGVTTDWDGWWERVAADPALAGLVERRREIFGGKHATGFMPPMSWHLAALRDAGFAEVGLVWRGGTDAAVAAVRG